MPENSTKRGLPSVATGQVLGAAASSAVAPPADTSLTLRINSKSYSFAGDGDTPLLWYLRDVLRLTGTKYGCGIGICGACTVHVDGKAQRACMTPIKTVAKRDVLTIEGLAGANLHPLQIAWIEKDAVQCGYCQAGQIMAAADLLHRVPNPSDEDIGRVTNLCRCGTYPRIRKAIKRAAEIFREAAALEAGQK